MLDMPLVVLLGGTVVALSVVSILYYGRTLKRSEAIQDVSVNQQARAAALQDAADAQQARCDAQQERYDAQQERAAALLDRHEALLTRAEELVRRLESRDLS